MELGRCFESSCEAFMDMKEALPGIYNHLKDIRLVHGLVVGAIGENKGVQYAHGWVEFSMSDGSDFCYDTETGFLVVKSTFYTVGKIKEACAYTMKQVLDQLCRYEHYGPWESFLVEAEKGINPSFKDAVKGVHYG
jgi:hypothetical protein